jgi:hypothetical protein
MALHPLNQSLERCARFWSSWVVALLLQRMHLREEADPFELVFRWLTGSSRGGIVGGGKGGMGAKEEVGGGCCSDEDRAKEGWETSANATAGG